MSTLQIACGTDRRGVPHSAAMLHSALSRNEGLDIEISFLHGPDLSSRQMDRLRGMVEGLGGSINFLLVPGSKVEGLRPMNWAPPATWYRLFLPELAPDLDRVLYLDTDAIVLGSLAPLQQVELGDHQLAAVTNVLMREHAHRIDELGLPGPASYFNCGVLLINLKLWREQGCGQAVLDFAINNPGLIAWGDQDAINMVLPNRLGLHPKWNCTNAILLFDWAREVLDPEQLEQARTNPVVRHFEGPSINKPWHLLCDRPMRDVYFEHRRQTPWPRCRRTGMTPANLARWLARRVG